MVVLFIGLWIAGGAPAALLGEVVGANDPRLARAGRIAFAFLLWGDLLLAAVFLAVGADAPTSPMSRSLWWVTVILAGIPLALVSGFAVRRGYTGHRLALAAATLTTAALYLAFPLGFTPETRPRPTGLGRWAHDHHLLGIAVLLIPTLILLADELHRRGEVTLDPELELPSIRSRLAAIPRRGAVGVAAVLLVLLWIAGTNTVGIVIGLGVVFGGSALYLWHRHRLAVRSALRDLGPPEKS